MNTQEVEDDVLVPQSEHVDHDLLQAQRELDLVLSQHTLNEWQSEEVAEAIKKVSDKVEYQLPMLSPKQYQSVLPLAEIRESVNEDRVTYSVAIASSIGRSDIDSEPYTFHEVNHESQQDRVSPFL